LTRAQDAQPGASGIVRVGAKPGAAWRYSGGGYLILQLLIEEASHQSFNDYMVHAVLRPLGMTESTFVNPDEAHLADFYDADGSKVRAETRNARIDAHAAGLSLWHPDLGPGRTRHRQPHRPIRERQQHACK
jgi:CubicO group peptidase (beta-lactamase class C family)